MLNNLRDIITFLWKARKNLPLAYKMLTDSVCTECSFGIYGTNDWADDSKVLCPSKVSYVTDEVLNRGLEERSNFPLIRRKQDSFSYCSWNEAVYLIKKNFLNVDPHKIVFFAASKGIANEQYYVLQKFARLLSTNNLLTDADSLWRDNAEVLKEMLGLYWSTCSFKDILSTDLLLVIDGSIHSRQPLIRYYLKKAKDNDIKIACLGTRFVECDYFASLEPTKIGAFLTGAMKTVVTRKKHDTPFLYSRTSNPDQFLAQLDTISWEALEAGAGSSQREMEILADLYINAERCVVLWDTSMAVDNSYLVMAVVSFVLLRGMIGRHGTGIVPIWKDPGIVGAKDLGFDRNRLAGLEDVDNGYLLEDKYGFKLPSWRGEAEVKNPEVVLLFGDPDIEYVREIVDGAKFVVHFSRKKPSTDFDNVDTLLVLPLEYPHEMLKGYTVTNCERRVVYSPNIAFSSFLHSYQLISLIAAEISPNRSKFVNFYDSSTVRKDINKLVGHYRGISFLREGGDNFQYEGTICCTGWRFRTKDGKAFIGFIKV